MLGKQFKRLYAKTPKVVEDALKTINNIKKSLPYAAQKKIESYIDKAKAEAERISFINGATLGLSSFLTSPSVTNWLDEHLWYPITDLVSPGHVATGAGFTLPYWFRNRHQILTPAFPQERMFGINFPIHNDPVNWGIMTTT